MAADIREVPLKDIIERDRKRPAVASESLGASIEEVGLLHPIIVRPTVITYGGTKRAGYELVCGGSRLATAKASGQITIEVSIRDFDDRQAEITQIVENTDRRNLTVLQEAVVLRRLKELREIKHPEGKQGGDRGNQHTGGKKCHADKLSVCQEIAAATGKTDRDTRRKIRWAAKIDEGVQLRIANRPEIANSGVELDALSKLEPKQQAKVVDKIEAGKAKSVRQATALLKPKPKKKAAAVDSKKARYDRLHNVQFEIAGFHDLDRERLLTWLLHGAPMAAHLGSPIETVDNPEETESEAHQEHSREFEKVAARQANERALTMAIKTIASQTDAPESYLERLTGTLAWKPKDAEAFLASRAWLDKLIITYESEHGVIHGDGEKPGAKGKAKKKVKAATKVADQADEPAAAPKPDSGKMPNGAAAKQANGAIKDGQQPPSLSRAGRSRSACTTSARSHLPNASLVRSGRPPWSAAAPLQRHLGGPIDGRC